MSKPMHTQAAIPHPSGKHSPDMPVPVDTRYQVAVTCGAHAASGFMAEDASVSLQAHLPASLAFFLRQSKQSADVLGVAFDDYRQALTDAFVAGYLGRIQQELRLIRPSPHRQQPGCPVH